MALIKENVVHRNRSQHLCRLKHSLLIDLDAFNCSLAPLFPSLLPSLGFDFPASK
jgi:hypothetical protein